ncbi:MAG: hypothetical protein M3R51_02285 [Candidatus Eremiobacteraeota bacterium]|nr:hypothetical protein [Candidatus Eremiobacteraeota bacterium]
MPRQIIDTESSRPAYLRRRIITWIVALVIVVVIGLVAVETLRAHPHFVGASIVAIPGNSVAQGNQGPIPQDRRGHAA